MNMSFGNLELNRTSAGHLGTSAISGFKPAAEGKESGGIKKAGFEDYILQAFNEMNGQQLKVSQLNEQIVTDPESVDIHDVTTSMAKAKMSMDLAQTVIERLVKGWTDLSQNR
ncbi:MAG: flagellar hook-basal body complex protein FliE [Treponema sp.]|nr:flagellar hook-basal body complex protein FliE [Treponema sp.]